MKKNKLLYLLGAIAIIYLIAKPSKQKNKQKPQTQPQSEDTSLRSSFNVVPLPDIKNYKFSSVVPMQVIGATSSSPIIVATSTR